MKPQVAERLAQEKQKLVTFREKASEHLKLYPYELEPVGSVQNKVFSTKMNKFLDISFPPENSSAFW